MYKMLFKLLGFATLFICGCSEKNYILKKQLSDGSRVFVFQFNGLSTSEAPFWVLRKVNGECYLTGKIDASRRFEKVEVSNETISGFTFSINYRITDIDTSWVHYNINFRDTFCFNSDCKKYPVICDEYE